MHLERKARDSSLSVLAEKVSQRRWPLTGITKDESIKEQGCLTPKRMLFQ